MATCPECDADLDVDEYDVDKGDLLSCPECGSNLEVVSVSPLEIEAAQEDDDEDDDDEEEEDDAEDEDDEEDDDDPDGYREPRGVAALRPEPECEHQDDRRHRREGDELRRDDGQRDELPRRSGRGR